MPVVYIICSSKDFREATKVKEALNDAGIDTWNTHTDIQPGESFDFNILTQFDKSCAVVLILSGNAMRSQLVCNEIAAAVQKGLFILPVRVDYEKLTPVIDLMLQKTQIMDGYGMEPIALRRIVTTVSERLALVHKQNSNSVLTTYIEDEIGVEMIADGEPYFEEGRTLFVKLSKDTFLLAPPTDIGSEAKVWAQERNFSLQDCVFGGSLLEYTKMIPIEGLYERIEQSRIRVFEDFHSEKNGCYFNNPKYGIEQVTPFARTADEAEHPKMTITLYSTDYFTHRVIKDVCKQLLNENNEYLTRSIDYAHIGPNRLFFTSLGINLLLAEDPLTPDAGILITRRSTNAAETYGKTQYSLSVIEGVSVSDYDTKRRKILLKTAAERGLLEELGVRPEMLKMNSLRFHQLFVNKANLELGIWGIVSLNQGLTIENDVIPLHGKDEKLEIADCQLITANNLETFIHTNKDNILPQAMYVLCAYLESEGRLIIDRRTRASRRKI